MGELAHTDAAALPSAPGLYDLASLRLARFIQSNYAPQGGLRRVLQMFGEGRSGTEIARAFAVTKQRVNQWKRLLGVETLAFKPLPVVSRLLSAGSASHEVNDAAPSVVAHGGGPRRRSRHKQLVRVVRRALQAEGVDVVPRHPLDLLVRRPVSAILEAKIVQKNASASVREAMGQLLYYRQFYGPHDAHLCIVLDREPVSSVREWAEERDFVVVWWRHGALRAEGRSANWWSEAGIRLVGGASVVQPVGGESSHA